MVSEAVSARDRAKEEKAAMALRISHMEEEREGKAVAGGWHTLNRLSYLSPLGHKGHIQWIGSLFILHKKSHMDLGILYVHILA